MSAKGDQIVTNDEVLSILPPYGFMRDYVLYASRMTDASWLFHLGSALAVLSVAPPLTLHINHHGGRMYPNLYIMLIGSSALDRKGKTMSIAEDILTEGIPERRGDTPSSWEGLLDSMQLRPQQIVLDAEFSRFLTQSRGDGYLKALKDGYTDVYDCLDSETEILTVDGWCRMGQVHVGDIVFSLNRETLRMEGAEAQAVMDRTVEPGERMVVRDDKRLNIRVTEGHDFHTKYPSSGPNTVGPRLSAVWETWKGRDIVERGKAFGLPLAAEFDGYPGIPLTDDEIRLVAWFMTDGGWGNIARTRLSINQSKPAEIQEIRELLTRLELDFSEYPDIAPGPETYPNARPRTMFVIPKGTHGGTYARHGWNKYAPYLDKSVSPLLHQMTQAQFRVFWNEALKSDGAGGGDETLGQHPWRGAHLWCDETQRDVYQQMAVTRGFATCATLHVTDNGVRMFMVSVREKQWLVSDPADEQSARFTFAAPKSDERVWCVTNRNGTLVTRRYGKVAILGNCKSITRKTVKNAWSVQNPRLSLFAAIDPTLFERRVDPEDFTGGFYSRWIVLWGPRGDHYLDKATPDEATRLRLALHLKKIMTLIHPSTVLTYTPQAEQVLLPWKYEVDCYARRSPREIAGLAVRSVNVCEKVAMLLAIDEYVQRLPSNAKAPESFLDKDKPQAPLWITHEHVEWAKMIANVAFKCGVQVLNVIAPTQDLRDRRSVLEALRAQDGRALLGDLIGKTRTQRRKLQPVLESLQAEGLIQPALLETDRGGREGFVATPAPVGVAGLPLAGAGTGAGVSTGEGTAFTLTPNTPVPVMAAQPEAAPAPPASTVSGLSPSIVASAAAIPAGPILSAGFAVTPGTDDPFAAIPKPAEVPYVPMSPNRPGDDWSEDG